MTRVLLSLFLFVACSSTSAAEPSGSIAPPSSADLEVSASSAKSDGATSRMPQETVNDPKNADKSEELQVNEFSPVQDRGSGASPQPWSAWQGLDQAFDTALAAALAALAVAVATFLISITGPISERVRWIRDKGGTPGPEDKKRLTRMKTAITQLMLSFYFFVGFLVGTLTIDQWEEPGAWLSEYEWATPVDLLATGGSFTVGLLLLGLGARSLKEIVIDDSATLDSHSGEDV